MRELTSQQLKEKIASGADFALVDVREQYEHDAGNLGGICVPLSEIQLGEFSEIPKDKEVVLYCRSGSRSGVALMLLARAGYQNIAHLEGGLIGYGAL